MMGGQMLQVQTPSGMMQVQIPQGLQAGQVFQMQVPMRAPQRAVGDAPRLRSSKFNVPTDRCEPGVSIAEAVHFD